jgi:hypothetical protein
MKKFAALLFVSALLQLCTSKPQVNYIDKDFPGSVPKIFAPGIVSKPGRLQQNLTMSADGSEYYLGVTDALGGYTGIVSVKVMAGKTVHDTLFYYPQINQSGEPFLSPDGKTLYLVGNHPFDIWVSRRDEKKPEWSFPARMNFPVNTKFGESHPSLSEGGTIFFASTREDEAGNVIGSSIYCAEPALNEYTRVRKLEGDINMGDVTDPCVSQDESYIIFAATRDGGFGENDLYISFRDGSMWSAPKNLGSAINTDALEAGPYLSPDEKYLFFHRREKSKKPSYSDIYWVSTDFIESLQEKK